MAAAGDALGGEGGDASAPAAAWIFGYGSLMCADSRARSGQTGLAVRVWQVHGRLQFTTQPCRFSHAAAVVAAAMCHMKMMMMMIGAAC